MLERAAMLRQPGRWQLHAAIAACHTDTRDGDATDWLQVLTLYDMLLAYDRVAHRATEPRGGARRGRWTATWALDDVDALRAEFADYHLWHAVRAHLLRGLESRRRGAWRKISARWSSPRTTPSGAS